MIKQYQSTHYVGKNIILVATGKVNHQEFVQMVNNELGNLNKNQPEGLEKLNTEKPLFTPSCMFMRDDQLYNAGVGVFYDAPSWFHEDYYSFLLLERVLGSYSLDKNGPAHLNDWFKQYSTFEAYLGSLPDVTKGLAIYSPYRDCGLFGTYMYGNEVFSRYMAYTGIFVPAQYGTNINIVEVYRARARLWQELLNIQSPADVLQLIGPQILYLNRRVTRSEIAKRVSFFDNKNLQKVCRHWLHDAEPSIVAYGPIESLYMIGSYQYYKINSYVSNVNLTHSLV